MIELSQHLRLALESSEPFRIVRKRFRQDFYGYVAPELVVVRLIHLAHAPRTDLRENAVRAEFGACWDSHRFPLTGVAGVYRGQAGIREELRQLRAKSRLTEVIPADPIATLLPVGRQYARNVLGADGRDNGPCLLHLGKLAWCGIQR
jgi:hypothetical protein